MHRFLAILLCGGWLAFEARAQVFRGTPVTVESRTRKFIVHGDRLTPQAMVSNDLAGTGRVRLDPTLLAVACEQIRDAFLNEIALDAGAQRFYRPQSDLRKIFIVLHRDPEQPALISVAPGVQTWGCRLDLASEMEPTAFVTALVQALLFDFAGVEPGAAEMPDWLVAGLSAHLQAGGLDALPLQANVPVSKARKTMDALEFIRERFRTEIPLTFDEMSWPARLDEKRLEEFGYSAHLFVSQLLRLRHGRACLREMLAEMPNYKNWQFAFLRGFSPHFRSLVDVEKWWSLSLVQFTGRDPAQIWSHEESWEKLKTALDVPVKVHLTTGRLPSAAYLSLQEVISQWDFPRQQITLRKTINQLHALRLRVRPEFVPLVNDYRSTLENYLERRAHPTANLRKGEPIVNVNVLKRTVCRRLDELDNRRAELRDQTSLSSAR